MLTTTTNSQDSSILIISWSLASDEAQHSEQASAEVFIITIMHGKYCFCLPTRIFNHQKFLWHLDISLWQQLLTKRASFYREMGSTFYDLDCFCLSYKIHWWFVKVLTKIQQTTFHILLYFIFFLTFPRTFQTLKWHFKRLCTLLLKR